MNFQSCSLICIQVGYVAEGSESGAKFSEVELTEGVCLKICKCSVSIFFQDFII
jgi:hypothetical protein